MSNSNKMGNRLIKAVRNFRNDSGSTTVEFVLWVPIFMVILALTVDVSLMFLRQSNMWQVARDTARQVSIYNLTEAEGEAYATTNATFSGDVPNVDVAISLDQSNVQVLITVGMDVVGVFGILNVAAGTNLVANVTYRMEPI